MLWKLLFRGVCTHWPQQQQWAQQRRQQFYKLCSGIGQRKFENAEISRSIEGKRLRSSSAGAHGNNHPVWLNSSGSNNIAEGHCGGQKSVAQQQQKQQSQKATQQKMYKQSCCNLLTLSPEKVKEWLDSFDAVLADCDGVLWVYSNVIDGSVETMNRFKAIGKKSFFCTNNSTKSRKELLAKSQGMGFNITDEEIISSAHSAAAYLKNRNFAKKVYVVGESGIAKELDAVGIRHTEVGPDVLQGTMGEYLAGHFQLDDDVGAVIVGFDQHFSFPKMTKAASYLNRPGCIFLATNTDERFPMPKMVVPGSGSFVRAIETCSERQAFVIGKPNPSMCEWLITDGVLEPSRTLMIGDRCNTDILLGYNCGFQTMLVETGIHKLSDVEVWQKSNDPELKKLIPDVFLPKLGDLLPYLK